MGVCARGGGGALQGVCAVVKSAVSGGAAPAYEMKVERLTLCNLSGVVFLIVCAQYVATAPEADAHAALGALVVAAEQYAAEQKAEQLLALHNGAMSDAEKKWGPHGFKLNGVGPAPEFQVRLCKALK